MTSSTHPGLPVQPGHLLPHPPRPARVDPGLAASAAALLSALVREEPLPAVASGPPVLSAPGRAPAADPDAWAPGTPAPAWVPGAPVVQEQARRRGVFGRR